MTFTSIVMSAMPTNQLMAKKNEEMHTHQHSLLEIQIPKYQEMGSSLAISIPSTPPVLASPLPTATPALLSAVQTIAQLGKADPECY